MVYVEVVFNYWMGYIDYIGFLEGIFVDQGGCDLIVQNYYGDGIYKGGGNVGNGVGGFRI